MRLPTEEEYAMIKTKTSVTEDDIVRFKGYTKSLDSILVPVEKKIRDCNINEILESGCHIEIAINRMNQEITRMIRQTPKALNEDVAKSAKDFRDIVKRYNKAKDILYHECHFTRRK